MKKCADLLVDAARALSERVRKLSYSPPVTCVYNPLEYAWSPHERYLRRYGAGAKRVVFLGMNPGPFGMVQTGVPFGEVAAVRGWLGIEARVDKPRLENPSRPVEGFACRRSEVSGQRLWGLFAKRFISADRFFAQHFVANYCPLAFFAGKRNLTPDRLGVEQRAAVLGACDDHLREVVAALRPEWLVGVGAWAEKRAREACGNRTVRIGHLLHPSPASPLANRGWAELAEKQLIEQGVWG